MDWGIGWQPILAVVLSTLALGLSALPLWQLPKAQNQFAQAFDEFSQQIASTNQNPEPNSDAPSTYHCLEDLNLDDRLRPTPFNWLDLFRGIPVNEARIDRAIPFAQPDGIPLYLNLYHSPSQINLGQPNPTIVIIYGGAWRTGSPDAHEVFSRYMAGQGYTVVAISYRHAPQYQFPCQLQDVYTACQYIAQHQEQWGVDINRVALMGRSAGGLLALLGAYQDCPIPIRAVVNYYGPCNLKAGYEDPPIPDPIQVRSVLQDFLGDTPTNAPQAYRQASPLWALKPGLPPSLLVYGKRDHLVKAKFGQELYQRLKAENNPVLWLEIPWAEHAFDHIFPGLSNQLVLYYTERFLALTLKS